MTEKQNLLIALRGGTPDWVPCHFSATNIMPVDGGDRPPRGVAEGTDGFGVRWVVTESGGGAPTVAPQRPLLTDITRWREQVVFPDLDAVDWAAEAQQKFQQFAPDRENKVLDMFCANGMFERLHFLMGFEEALVAIMTEPEAVYDFAGAVADHKIRLLEYTAKHYAPDIFTYLDDFTYSEGAFFSPDLFRELFQPHLRRIVEACGRTGMLFKQHCCGRMEVLADDFFGAGVRVFDPVQPLNDLRALKDKYAGRACFVGGLDLGIVDRDGVSEEELRAEVRRCIDTYAPGGGYVVYGASLSLYDRQAFLPGGRIGIVADECARYGRSRRPRRI